MERKTEGVAVYPRRLSDSNSPTETEVKDEASQTSGAPQQPTTRWRTCGLWLEEVLWCLLSLLFLLVIVVVMRTFDGSALPALPMNVTLNTFLAFFTTLTKASFMIAVCEALSQWKWNWFATNTDRPLHDFQLFDGASRGAWGSLQLLFGRLRGRHLASLGAILPIVSIITSPITQQTIRYPLKRSEVGGIATVPAVRHYKSDEDSMGYGTGPILAAASSGLTAAHGVNLVPSVPPNCTSEECTFPRFSTLGICTRLNNVTSALKVTRLTNATGPDWTAVQKKTFETGIYKDYDTSVSYNATLPGSGCYMVHPFPAGIMICGAPRSFVEEDDDFRYANFFTIGIIAGGPRGWYLANDTLVADDWKDIHYQAYEINMAACVKTFEARFVDGVPKVEQVGTSFAVEKELSRRANVTCEAISLTESSSWQCNFEYANRSAMNDSTPLLVLKDPSKPDSPSLDPSDHFTIDWYTLTTISFLQNILYTAVWTWDPITGESGTINGMRVDTLWGHIITYLSRSPNPREQMSNLQLAADNIATAYTNGLLTSPPMRGAPNAFPVHGTNWAQVTFVEIRWGWLTFLAVELVLAVVFLVATAVYTRRHGVQVLKSSALATFFAPAEDCRAAIGGVGGGVGDMKKKARGAYVRFTGSEMVLTDRADGEGDGAEGAGPGRGKGLAGRRRLGKTW